LERLRQHTNDASVELLLEDGQVADALLGISESRGIDLVVVGTRGHRRIQRLLLGSVAEKLSRQARCPVLVVPDSAVSYDSEIGLKTILCPTNFSERSRAALKQAWDLAKSFSAHILLMHAVEDSTLDRANRLEQRNATEERMKRISALLVSEKASPEIEFVVEFGPIAQAIARVAAEREASLIVLSIQRSKPVVAHLPPEITYSVAQQVSCPVFTIAS
jgi:nucleotide-binding universal stress UspA family protein